MSRAAAFPQLDHPIARVTRGGSAALVCGAVFAVAILVAAAILLHFHDVFWWAPDEGAYAHVAERILQGEVLNGSIQDIHMGYVHFANALAFKLFGLDLVSLRYPLVAMTLVQCALVFWLLAGRGVLVAFAAALAMSCLSLIQFLNPTAQWYALFLCVVIVTLLSAEGQERRGRLELLGFLLVTLFLFRQLSGLFALFGVLTFLLLQEPRHGGRQRALVARGLALAMLAGLALYLRAKIDLAAAVLFGGAPLLILCYTAAATQVADRVMVRQLLRLGCGGLVALLPLLTYHLTQGSLLSWWDDSVTALARSDLRFLSAPSYAALSLQGLAQALSGGKTALFNGFFWFLLPLLPALLGLVTLRALLRGAAAGRAALPLVACFFALVSVQHQIPLYLFFSAALTLAGLLYFAAGAPRFYGVGFACAVVWLSLVGLNYQAGQPLTRTWDEIVAGKTSSVMMPSGLARASLTITADEVVHYGYVMSLVESETTADDSIVALPVNPELYFLARRRNPLRFFNAALGLRDEADLAAAEAALAADPPRLVFYRPGDKYTTPWVRRLMSDLRPDYRLLDSREGLEIYLRNE
jgi:hypothetical protein